MKKCFPSHQFLNQKNDARFLLSVRCISILIMIAFVYIPLNGFAYHDRVPGKLKQEKIMELTNEKSNKITLK